MNKHWQYLKYVARHKWFVYQAGRELRVSLWQLLIHDWSKFTPAEWFPYVEFFYGVKLDSAFERDELLARRFNFDKAWLHHIHLNPHHPQHWVLKEDSGKTVVLDMPRKYRMEMLADWVGAGRAQSNPETTVQWYKENKDNHPMSDDTRFFVEEVMKANPALFGAWVSE